MKEITKDKIIVFCDECGNKYYQSYSKVESLCPECTYFLYGYEKCIHDFKNGRCLNCFWDGSVSDYIINLKK
jgi:predicted RNA-binding Zn-ribbon protein involved in translation (DUF1610 family)